MSVTIHVCVCARIRAHVVGVTAVLFPPISPVPFSALLENKL